ncbi:N-acetylglutamate synthase-like GNAT family acetyltransferase [Leucobacter luti]|uniref:N-acetylglutamate synthase-like GNAT family acetyltransferase n=3 Tax=Leucobacter luti TaxID=340320 RepID=A0A4R6S0V9_9MICO|nr:GNAT family N-acetyltransferase [Leucobacter luti]TDP93152.1 N-acetylglutamate synthase-like GNAT family acetyltransferase [Leucobacter luti]
MGERLVLRRAAGTDVPAIQALVRAAYAPYVERIGREPAPMHADYPSAVLAGNAIVAQHEARIVGVLVCEPINGSLHIENVAVHPDAQGLGVGSALLAHAETLAVSLRLPEIRLYTNARMTENLAYYPRRGFTEVDRRVEDGFDRVFFVRRVEGPQ